MIAPGTLVIRKGSKVPAAIDLSNYPGSGDWVTVEGGAALLDLKAKLTGAGWNYFYMSAVKQTVFGRGAESIAAALKSCSEQMLFKECNSLQIDAITPHSFLGIPYVSVSAHCCHIQEDVIFRNRR